MARGSTSGAYPLMRIVDYLTVGWVQASIGKLIENSPRLLTQFQFIHVTSIDSGIDLRSMMMVQLIMEQFRECEPLGSGLLVPSDRIEEIYAVTHIFTGFDEVWCFDEKPKTAKPADLWIVAPLNIDQEGVPPLLVPWMKESGCRLGLGDGIGLNYSTPDGNTARCLELMDSR